MSGGIKYRHELKYPITASQLGQLNSRLKHLAPLDRHTDHTGCYQIRSLYFDDYEDRCIRENEDGTDPREKFRIRIYNHSTQHITLECKRKAQGKTWKDCCPLTLEQTRQLMKGRPLSGIGSQPPLLRKLTMQMLTRQLRPKVIVEYCRTPYVYQNGNVRITLDQNIASSKDVGQFLEARIPLRPVLALGQQLLEVKYDEYLPDFLYRSLQLENLQQTSFSKYYICRKFTI